nr:dual specificity protein phosphatase family protein [Candidatus Eremiobacteraeota bacterium]
PILDLTAPTADQMREMATFIAAHAQRGVVYVHCKIGYSRSAAAAIAFLLQTAEVSTADAGIARLRAVRPSIVVRPEIRDALARFERALVTTVDTPAFSPRPSSLAIT